MCAHQEEKRNETVSIWGFVLVLVSSLVLCVIHIYPLTDRRVLLNKADTIDTQQLMRVYGALMWSLGKVMQTPEVCRVYIGSFWEAPLSNFENRFLLEVSEERGG